MKKLGLLVLSLMVAFVLAACAPAADAMAHNDAMAGEDAMAEKDAMAGDAMMEASYTATLSGAAEVPTVETERHQLRKDRAGIQREWLDHRHGERKRAARHLRPHVGPLGPTSFVHRKRLEMGAGR